MLLHLWPFQCLDLLCYVSTARFSVSSYHGLPFHILDLLQLHEILPAELAQVWGFTVLHTVDSQAQFRVSSTLTTGIYRDPPFVVGFAFLFSLYFFLTVIIIISSMITYFNILRVLNVQNTKPASLNPQNQAVSAGFWRGCGLPKAVSEECWISAATTLRWHQPKCSSEEFLLRNDQNEAATAAPPAQLQKLPLPEPALTPPNQIVLSPTPNNTLGQLFLVKSPGGNTAGMGTLEWRNTKTCLKRFW